MTFLRLSEYTHRGSTKHLRFPAQIVMKQENFRINVRHDKRSRGHPQIIYYALTRGKIRNSAKSYEVSFPFLN